MFLGTLNVGVVLKFKTYHLNKIHFSYYVVYLLKNLKNYNKCTFKKDKNLCRRTESNRFYSTFQDEENK